MTALAPRPRTAVASAAALVDAAVDGDEQAWRLLCDRHLNEVRAVARARLRDEHMAQDVVQETLLRAWTRLHQLDDPERLGAWLKTIAAHVTIDHVRRERVTTPLEQVTHPAAPLPTHDEVIVAREEAAVLHNHLGALRDVDRVALWRRDGLGVPVAELAGELGMTPGSVRVLLTRARGRVRRSYGLLAAPVLAFVARVRSRSAGLGDALPIAVAAPALVIATIAGVAVPALIGGEAPAPEQSVQVAPEPVSASTPVELPLSTAPEPTMVAPGVEPVVATTPEAPAADDAAPAPRSGPRIGAGPVETGFSDEPPTDSDEDISTPDAPNGPVAGLDVYLEDAGLDGIG